MQQERIVIQAMMNIQETGAMLELDFSFSLLLSSHAVFVAISIELD